MAYGPANALSFLQSFMSDIFRDMLQNVIVYLEDILIYSKDLTEHICQVRPVLHRLLTRGLYAKAEKCEFHKTELTFLSYHIGPWGLAWTRVRAEYAQKSVRRSATSLMLFLQQQYRSTAYSSLQLIFFSGLHVATVFFKLHHKFCLGFKSGNCDGHSRIFGNLFWNQDLKVFDVCLGSLSCWIVQWYPSFSFLREGMFSRRFSWHKMN